jgi:hypothetical protein
MPDDLTYLYAIVPQAGLPEVLGTDLRGVDGAPLEERDLDGLCAILSSVPATEWGPGVIDEHVQDMDWLAPRATSHQTVVAALHTIAPSLLPLPFATLYHRRAAVDDLLTERREDLIATLERLSGSDEWTLKVFLDRPVFEHHVERLSPAFAEAVEQVRTAPPGKAYLLRKQLETLRRDETTRMSTLQAHEIEDQIRGLVHDVIREPIAGQAAATGTRGATEGMRAVLKLALLLRRDEQKQQLTRLEDIAEEYTSLGFRFELAGPWPPYSFATIAREDNHG